MVAPLNSDAEFFQNVTATFCKKIATWIKPSSILLTRFGTMALSKKQLENVLNTTQSLLVWDTFLMWFRVFFCVLVMLFSQRKKKS